MEVDLVETNFSTCANEVPAPRHRESIRKSHHKRGSGIDIRLCADNDSAGSRGDADQPETG